MKTERLTWDEIKKQFDKEWVELVDYDWPEEASYPHSGTVRSHGAEKKDFHQQCRREPVPTDSAILFVGKPEIPAGTILCGSLMKIEYVDS